jgi:hypothetical protein
MPISFEGLANNDNTYGNNRRTSKFWRPTSGDNVVRILPPDLRYFKEDINYFTYVYTNHFIPIDKGQFEVFRCLRDSPENPKCPACQFFFKHRKSENEDVAKMAGRFNSSPRHIMNVIVLEQEGASDVPEGVQVFECGPGVYDDIKLYAANKRYGDIFHPKEGRNMIIHLTPGNEHKTGRNQYNVNPDDGNTSIVHLLGEDWKERIAALESNIPEFPTLEYVQGVVDTAMDLVGLQESPRGKVSAGSPVSPPKAAEEDDSIQIDDDEDDLLMTAEDGGDKEDEFAALDDFDGLLDDDDLGF